MIHRSGRLPDHSNCIKMVRGIMCALGAAAGQPGSGMPEGKEALFESVA
jgi:hypothetical protein